MSADFHTLLRSVGHSAQSIHPADLERSHALLERGADPVTALTKAAILNALEHQHLSLDEIEGIFGEDALSHVYGGTARDGLAGATEQGDAREGFRPEEGSDAGGEQLRRAGEDHEADQSSQADGPTEHAGGAERDGTEAEGPAASAGDAATEGAAEGEGRLEGVAERLSAIAAELGAIVAELNGEPEDGKIAVRAHFRRVKPATDT